MRVGPKAKGKEAGWDEREMRVGERGFGARGFAGSFS